jgi:hypothetical protein
MELPAMAHGYRDVYNNEEKYRIARHKVINVYIK